MLTINVVFACQAGMQQGLCARPIFIVQIQIAKVALHKINAQNALNSILFLLMVRAEKDVVLLIAKFVHLKLNASLANNHTFSKMITLLVNAQIALSQLWMDFAHVLKVNPMLIILVWVVV